MIIYRLHIYTQQLYSKKMTAYKDIEKRKMYQKLWAREKAIKKKAMISEPVIVESAVEITNKIEINTPPRKIYDGYSMLYLENERQGKSQSPAPIIWKKRDQSVIKSGWNEPLLSQKRKFIRRRINGVFSPWRLVQEPSPF